MDQPFARQLCWSCTSSLLQSQLRNVQQELAINLVGMYTITRLVARRMAAQREGESLTFLA